jgi:D-arabinose 1-dehydrogenase-like Zn-dependent alcohol dehydrogenase
LVCSIPFYAILIQQDERWCMQVLTRMDIGSNAGNLVDAKEALEYAAAGHIKVSYTLRKMEELTEIFNEMHSGTLIGRTVLDLQ